MATTAPCVTYMFVLILFKHNDLSGGVQYCTYYIQSILFTIHDKMVFLNYVISMEIFNHYF